MTFRPYPGFTIAAVILTAILCGLGVWQLERLQWKLNLIAMMDRNMHAQPVLLTDKGHLVEEVYNQYLRVAVQGHFDNSKEIYLFTTGDDGPVYHVLTPFISDGGRAYLVDRGMVDKDHLDPSSRQAGMIEGETRLVGIWRWPDPVGYFTPKPDIARRIWYGRDIPAISTYDRTEFVEGGIIEVDATSNPGGWPKGGQTVIDLPNNHLSYAITWFGLAAGLIGVYFAYHISKGRLVLGSALK
jgi:surfeit locus 1 family protein